MRELLVNPTVIKIAAIVLAIKELWLLLGIPAFTNTLISFLTVGAVPGTDRSLTPDEMYKLLFGVFVLFILLVFRKEIINLFHGWRHKQSIAPAMPLPHPHAPIIVHPPEALAPPQATEAGVAPKPSAIGLWLPLLTARWSIVRTRSASVLTAVLQKIRFAGVRVVVLVRFSARLLLRAALLLMIIIADIAALAWRMAEPHIRKFDAWLERKLHEYELIRTLLSIGGEMVDTARKWGANAKAAYDEASTAKSQRGR